MKPAPPGERTASAPSRPPSEPRPRFAMFLLRFLLKSVFLAMVTRLLGAFFPVARRLIRLVWR